jgi:hypothetical protein
MPCNNHRPALVRPTHDRWFAHLVTAIGRLASAIDAGVLDLVEDDRPADVATLTIGELQKLQNTLFPEEYFTPAVIPPATDTAPGSAARIAVYAERVRTQRVLFTPNDATASDRIGIQPGLAIKQRRNGSGPQVVGWYVPPPAATSEAE